VVRDRTGSLQLTFKKGTTPPELMAAAADTPRESVVEVVGTVKKSAKAQRGVELWPETFTVLSRAEQPLPLGVVDKVGAELDTRFDHRPLDLRKPEVRAIFELRAALLDGLRAALRTREFLEVETPKLLRQGAEGGSTLFSVNYFDRTAFLAQSPQLYKQMLIGAGFERVFEIAPAFRAEPSDTVRHLTEFASFDAEVGYLADGEELRGLLEGIVHDAIVHAREQLRAVGHPIAERLVEPKRPFPRITFAEAEQLLGRVGAGRDFGTEEEKRIGEIVVPRDGNPFYFLTEFPTIVKQGTFYARRMDSDPGRTEYFDLAMEGLELASGGPREHRLDRLLANMTSAGLDPADFAGYLEPFHYGMPPHGGWGFGIERLVQKLAGVPNIRETRLFPRDRWRLDP
jgi:nondiscriminating aspartyl-tRNA synthetase